MSTPIAMLLITSALYLLTPASGKHIPSFAGPYVIRLRRVTNVSEEFPPIPNLLQLKLHMTHPGRLNQPQYVWGYVGLMRDFDDTYALEVKLAQWSNNQWKPNAFVMRFPRGCRDARIHDRVNLKKLLGDDFVYNCPYKAGYSNVANHSVDLFYPLIPAFPYGRFLAQALWIKNHTVQTSLVVEFDIWPRLDFESR